MTALDGKPNRRYRIKYTLKLRMFVMHVCMCVYDQTLNANYTYLAKLTNSFVKKVGNLADPFYWQMAPQCLTKTH